MPVEKGPIRCVGCGKIIGDMDHLNDGKFTIKCKCGVMNTVEATPLKQSENYVYNQPYQNRMSIAKK